MQNHCTLSTLIITSYISCLVKDPQSTLNDMSTDFDHVLSSRSRVRRVCPTCNTPRIFSYEARCHSCNSELVVWYKKINTTNWVQPRKPRSDVSGAYLQCKHYAQGKICVKTPCKFAHGNDEVEIAELFRSKGAYWLVNYSCNVKLLHFIFSLNFFDDTIDTTLPPLKHF